MPLRTFLGMVDAPSQAEAVGILKWFLSLIPSVAEEQLQCGLEVIKWIARLRVHELHAPEVVVCKDHMDRVLSEATLHDLNMYDCCSV